MRDEGPSPEDLERFGGDTGRCPSCGEEVWDQADVCPSCGNYLGGRVDAHHPLERWWRGKWAVLIVGVLLAAMVLVFVV